MNMVLRKLTGSLLKYDDYSSSLMTRLINNETACQTVQFISYTPHIASYLRKDHYYETGRQWKGNISQIMLIS
jgi:hypothetical protein